MPGLGTDVECVVRGARRHEKRIAGPQGLRRPIVDHHLYGPGEDVTDLLAGVDVPARLDARRDLGEHLHDLPPGIDDGRCCSSVRLSFPASASLGSAPFSLLTPSGASATQISTPITRPIATRSGSRR